MDEAELVRQSLKGSEAAFSELVRLHQGRVRAYLARFVRNSEAVDDLAQEVFIAAYRNLGTYKGQSNLALWLLGISRNRALMYVRDESRRRARGNLASVLAAWREQELQAETLVDGGYEALKECVDELPKDSAQLVSDHYFNGLSAADVARRHGKKESAVRMMLLRIRQTLRRCVEGKLATEGAP